MFRRAAVATTAAMLYTGLAAGVRREQWCPQGHVGIDHVVSDGAYDVVIFVIEGPEAVVDPEGVPARVCM